MTNLHSILKSRDITLPTKVHLVKAMVFPVVMYDCESWTIKKAEHRRINALELWCWERFLRVPWTARRSNQSILKEISSEYSFERLMLKLKLWTLASWCKELTHWKRPWCWERWKVAGEGNDGGWHDWMPSPTQWTWVWVNSGSWWWTWRLGVLQFMKTQTIECDWQTELYRYIHICICTSVYVGIYHVHLCDFRQQVNLEIKISEVRFFTKVNYFQSMIQDNIVCIYLSRKKCNISLVFYKIKNFI